MTAVQVDEPFQLVLVQLVRVLVFIVVIEQDKVIVCAGSRVAVVVRVCASATEPPPHGAAEHRVGPRLHILSAQAEAAHTDNIEKSTSMRLRTHIDKNI